VKIQQKINFKIFQQIKNMNNQCPQLQIGTPVKMKCRCKLHFSSKLIHVQLQLSAARAQTNFTWASLFNGLAKEYFGYKLRTD